MNQVYQGHAGKGGLQKHSIGETYPWMVVGTLDKGGNTRWYVMNAVSGVIHVRNDGQNYLTVQAAEGHAKFLKEQGR